LEASGAALLAAEDEQQQQEEQQQQQQPPPPPRELKLVLSQRCPPGFSESAAAQGFALLGAPPGAAAGTALGRPFSAVEAAARVPEHAHAHGAVLAYGAAADSAAGGGGGGELRGVALHDPGHSHAQRCNDYSFDGGGSGASVLTGAAGLGLKHTKLKASPTSARRTGQSLTGVVVEDNAGGEHYPVLHVLVCEANTA
jgi:hypothetical protein